MMQATEARERHQTCRQARLGRNRPHRWRIFFKGVVGSVRVIIRDVIPDQTAHVSFADDDYVIQQLSATAPDPTLGHSILPGACGADACRFDAVGGQEIAYLLAKLAITIENRVAVRTSFRKGLPQLLYYPGADGVLGDIEMEDLASAVFDHEKAVQHPKGQSRHSEEVDGRDRLAVIAKESRPELAGLVGRRQATEEAGDGPFGDVKAGLEKFSVNSRCAPGWILRCHSLDQTP